MFKITLEGNDLDMCIKTSQDIHTGLRNSINNETVELLGPISSPISKIKNKFRYQILIKTGKLNYIREALEKFSRRYKSVNVIIDVDPISLL